MSNDVTQPEQKLQGSFYEIWFSSWSVDNLSDSVLSLYYNEKGINYTHNWQNTPLVDCTVTTIRAYEAPELMFYGTYKEAVAWLKENSCELVEGRVVARDAQAVKNPLKKS